jgi:hypothetical protein
MVRDSEAIHITDLYKLITSAALLASSCCTIGTIIAASVGVRP